MTRACSSPSPRSRTGHISAHPFSNKPVVVTRLSDGLGNQLFQYAAGRALASRLDADLLIDRQWFETRNDRPFELDAFAITARDAPAEGETYRQWPLIKKLLGRGFAQFVHDIAPPEVDIGSQRFSIFAERNGYHYDRRFEKLSGSICLKGFWQSARYLEPASDIVRQELQFKNNTRPANIRWNDRVKTELAVSMHVRRGDYLLSADRWTCSKDYYDRAMKFLRSRLNSPHFFIFSDDSAWCQENFGARDTTVVQDDQSRSGLDDLNLMAACRHHIIANSSFSWWGAWLANYPGQIVIAPKYWIVGHPTGDGLRSKSWSDFLTL